MFNISQCQFASYLLRVYIILSIRIKTLYKRTKSNKIKGIGEGFKTLFSQLDFKEFYTSYKKLFTDF